MVRNYREALAAVRSEMADLYDRYAANGILSNAEMTRYNRMRRMEEMLVETLRPYSAAANTTIRRLTGAQYEEAFYRRAWSFDNSLRTSLGWGQIPAEQVAAAVANPLSELARRDLTRNTLNRVRRAVASGLTRGASLPRMMRDIRGAMGVTTNDAMRIARTEAHRARELGNLAASDQAADWGVEIWRVWDAALDTRTRSSHAALDGVRRRPDSQFPGGALYPGGFGVASEDINCRCTVTDEIEGYEPRNRRTEQGTQPYVTFRDWARERGITGSRYGQAYNFL